MARDQRAAALKAWATRRAGVGATKAKATARKSSAVGRAANVSEWRSHLAGLGGPYFIPKPADLRWLGRKMKLKF